MHAPHNWSTELMARSLVQLHGSFRLEEERALLFKTRRNSVLGYLIIKYNILIREKPVLPVVTKKNIYGHIDKSLDV